MSDKSNDAIFWPDITIQVERHDYSDAIENAVNSNPEVLENSIAHQALERIAKFYEEEGKLKELPSDKRLQKDSYSLICLLKIFAWNSEILADSTILPKGKTADGLKYSLN